MSEKDKIESLFNSNFENLRVKPSDRLWNNIANELDKEFYFKNQFEDFKVAPSMQLWINIQKRLSLLNFFRFNINRFNIYYSLIILITVFSSIYYLNESPANTKFEQLTLSHKSPENSRTSSNISFDYEKTGNNNFIANNYQNNYTSEKTDKINNDITSDNSQIFFTDNTDNSNIANLSDDISSVNDFENTTNYTKVNPASNTETVIPANIKNPVVENVLSGYTTTDEDLNSFIQLKSKTIQSINYNVLSEPEEVFRKDTICFNVKGEPVVLKHSWDIEAYFTANYNTAIFNPGDENEPVYLYDFKNSYNPAFSYGYGLNVGYHNNNFVIQSGIAYSEINQNFNYTQYNYLVDTNITTNTLTYHYERPDTVWFIDMDLYNETGIIDSVFRITYYSEDSSHTIYITNYDTTLTKDKISSINKHKYFEIPFAFGYEMKSNKFTITPKIGLTAGFIIESSGTTLSYNEIGTTNLSTDNQPYIKPLFYWTSSIAVSYNLSKSVGIVIEPYYKETITSIFEKNYPLNQNFSIKAVRFGINYKF
ncbi:MAG: hypothetical protein Kow0068_05730 [Marinilabiliales bacterium]